MGQTSNRVICRNEVFIEGESVGQFTSFSLRANYRTFGATGVLTIPLYAVGISSLDRGTQSSTFSQGRARSRVRKTFSSKFINICAEVEVYCWYEGYEKTLVFHGYIEHVLQGFPTKIYVRDGSFILRFGEVEKGWNSEATLQKIVSDCIPIAEKAFKAEREKYKMTHEVPALVYTDDTNNTQAVTTPLSFENFAQGRAPFEVLQHLMQQLVLFAGVTNDNKVYIGAGVQDTTREVINLDTRYNVIDRSITPTDGRFVSYDVKVTGVLKNGKKYTATGGLKTSRSTDQKSELDKITGESHRGFTLLDTAQGIQECADRMLAMLKGDRNKGKLTTLLYPKMQLLDHVGYNDTVFEENSGLYYVIGYTFEASERGYYQVLEVTDQVFVL